MNPTPDPFTVTHVNGATVLELTLDGQDIVLITHAQDHPGVVIRLPLPVLAGYVEGFQRLTATGGTPTASDGDMEGGVTAALIEQEAERTSWSSVDALTEARKAGIRIRRALDLPDDATIGRVVTQIGALNSQPATRDCLVPCTHETDSEWWQDRWQEATDQRDARDGAARLWKEVTREHVRRARTALSYAEAAQLARAVASVTPCSCSAQRARAEKAEQERGKALREALRWREHAKAASERADAAERDRAERAERERDEALRLAAKAIDSESDTLRKLAVMEQPRPLTADDITDEMVLRGMDGWNSAGGRTFADAIRAALTAALTEPQRPEGAERFDPIVDAAIRGHSDITSPAVVHAIANALAEEGVRVTGGEER